MWPTCSTSRQYAGQFCSRARDRRGRCGPAHPQCRQVPAHTHVVVGVVVLRHSVCVRVVPVCRQLTGALHANGRGGGRQGEGGTPIPLLLAEPSWLSCSVIVACLFTSTPSSPSDPSMTHQRAAGMEADGVDGGQPAICNAEHRHVPPSNGCMQAAGRCQRACGPDCLPCCSSSGHGSGSSIRCRRRRGHKRSSC